MDTLENIFTHACMRRLCEAYLLAAFANARHGPRTYPLAASGCEREPIVGNCCLNLIVSGYVSARAGWFSANVKLVVVNINIPIRLSFYGHNLGYILAIQNFTFMRFKDFDKIYRLGLALEI